MPGTCCVHYILYLRVYFDFKRTWLCQERVVCIIFYIYVFILILSVPGYARNTPYALKSKSTLNKKIQIELFISIHVSSKDHHIYHT